MLLKSTISEIVKTQRINLIEKDIGLERKMLKTLPSLSAHALIISGIRRCGKSTLVFQLLKSKYSNGFFLNFEDPRLYEFERNDFTRLNEIIKEATSTLSSPFFPVEGEQNPTIAGVPRPLK